jgi:hypothetical protein
MLAFIYLHAAYGGSAARVYVYWVEARVLNKVGLAEIADLRAGYANAGIGIKWLHQHIEQLWGYFRIIVYNKYKIGLRLADAPIIAAGKAQVFFRCATP